MPTSMFASPTLYAGFARSTIAVGSDGLHHSLNHAAGSRQPQAKNEYHLSGSTRPRTASTETYTFGPHSPLTGNSITGLKRDSSTTCVSMMPLASIETSAVASRKGVRTCKRAVSPGA